MGWLISFGFIFIVVAALVIAVPYLRGTSHLMTTFNVFMLGSINFVGISAIQAGRYWSETQQSVIIRLEDVDIMWFLVCCTTFYITFLLAYRSKFLTNLTRVRSRRWPSPNVSPLLLVCCILLVISVIGAFFAPQVQFAGQIFAGTGPAAGIIAFGFCIYLVHRYPLNFALWLMMICFGALIVPMTVAYGTGRQNLLAFLLMPIILMYWMRGRDLPRKKVLFYILVAGVVSLGSIGSYTSIRHRYIATTDKPGTTQIVTENVVGIAKGLVDIDNYLDPRLIGSDAVTVSLCAIHESRNDRQGGFLFTLRYLSMNPIPRAWVNSKPEALGYTLPRDMGIWERTGYVNWGPGIAGHVYADGGIAVGVLYGLLFACFMKWFDQRLTFELGNPYFPILFGAFSGTWLGMSRGDIGVFIMLTIASHAVMLFALLILKFSSATKVVFSQPFQRSPLNYNR